MQIRIGNLGEDDRSVTMVEGEATIDINIMVGQNAGSFAPLSRTEALALASALTIAAEDMGGEEQDVVDGAGGVQT